MLALLMSHNAMVVLAASALVGLADFAFAINPKIAANGIVHFVYLQLKSYIGK